MGVPGATPSDPKTGRFVGAVEGPEALRERFESKFIPEPNSGCWLWTEALKGKGYGGFYLAGKDARAHRVSYELYVGAIPCGLTIDHLCRNKSCVNPDHLEAVTNRENVLRGVGTSAENARKTHCPQGLPFDELNTQWESRGRRRCGRCNRERNRASRRGKRSTAEGPGGEVT